MFDSTLSSWPGEPAVIGLRRQGGQVHEVFRRGPVDQVRAWASVSKTLAGLEFALLLEGDPDLGRLSVGPEGSTLAHLLAHASGLGFEADSPRVPVGTKRVYSNLGIDLAVEAMSDGEAADFWDRKIFRPLDAKANLEGRPSAGVVGNCLDLAKLASEWLNPTLVSVANRDAVRTVFLPELSGVVPGYGRFDPCWWGLGVEINGLKQHWMGEWPELSFGHFGQSGAFLLVNLEEGIALVATSSVEFGPWAKDVFHQVTSEARRELLAT